MRILYTRKSDGDAQTQQVVRAFEQSDSLEEIKQAVESADARLYVTWASVEARDSDNEIIPVDDLIEQNQILMERGAPISDEHTNRIVGKTLAWKVLEHPDTGTYGILHLNQIFNHNELDNQVWDEIQSGERGGSSVGGVSTGSSVELAEDGTGVHRIEGFSWMETASTGSPVNPYATNEAFSVVAKSLNKVGKPFAGYDDFEDCVAQNQDKQDPEAYCAAIKDVTEKALRKGPVRTVINRGFKKSQYSRKNTQQEESQMQDTNKRRVHLKPGEDAPEGVQVQTGPRGGRYYETGGSEDAEAEESAESQALEHFSNGLPAEDIITTLVESGESFESARAAAINAARDYANDPSVGVDFDAPSEDEVNEFVGYLEALTPEDLGIEAGGSESKVDSSNAPEEEIAAWWNELPLEDRRTVSQTLYGKPDDDETLQNDWNNQNPIGAKDIINAYRTGELQNALSNSESEAQPDAGENTDEALAEIETLASQYDDLTTSDLQGAASAIARKYGVDEDDVLEMTYDLVDAPQDNKPAEAQPEKVKEQTEALFDSLSVIADEWEAGEMTEEELQDTILDELQSIGIPQADKVAPLIVSQIDNNEWVDRVEGYVTGAYNN